MHSEQILGYITFKTLYSTILTHIVFIRVTLHFTTGLFQYFTFTTAVGFYYTVNNLINSNSDALPLYQASCQIHRSSFGAVGHISWLPTGQVGPTWTSPWMELHQWASQPRLPPLPVALRLWRQWMPGTLNWLWVDRPLHGSIKSESG